MSEYFELHEKTEYKNLIFSEYNNYSTEVGCIFAYSVLIFVILLKLFAFLLPFYGLIWYYFYSNMILTNNNNNNNNNNTIVNLQIFMAFISTLLILIFIILLPYLCWFLYITFHIIPIYGIGRDKTKIDYTKLNNNKFIDLCYYFYSNLPTKINKIRKILYNIFGNDISYIIILYTSNDLNIYWRNIWLNYPLKTKQLNIDDPINLQIQQLIIKGIDLTVKDSNTTNYLQINSDSNQDDDDIP